MDSAFFTPPVRLGWTIHPLLGPWKAGFHCTTVDNKRTPPERGLFDLFSCPAAAYFAAISALIADTRSEASGP